METTTLQTEQHHLHLVHAAAHSGVCQAQAMLGQMLLDGKLMPRDPGSAFHWFERAARGGDLMAVNMVGRCLDQGWGVARSPHLAAPWFRKAAERGLDWGMYNLATLLMLGSGVDQDGYQALHWFRKAAALQHAKSINILGGLYEDGWVVRKDMALARDLYRQAAQLGDFRGEFNHARMLLEDGSTDEALSWLQRVPRTATPAFLSSMKAFLQASSAPAIRDFADKLEVPAWSAAHVFNERTAAC